MANKLSYSNRSVFSHRSACYLTCNHSFTH